MPRNTQPDMYRMYNDNYDPNTMDARRARQAPPQDWNPPKLRAYHMRGRLLSYLSLPLGVVAVAMLLAAFVGPIDAATSANVVFACVAVGALALLVGLAGKIRGRKELDLPGWPSSFGMLFGFISLMVSSMVVYASFQTYWNYGEMLAEQQAAKEAEESTVKSVMGDDGETREKTDDERERDKQSAARTAETT